MSLFHRLGRINPGLRQVLMIRNKADIYGEELPTPRPTPKLLNHILLAVLD
jgi:hypothetical protein